MARPGTEVVVVDTPSIVGVPVDTGQFFIAGTAERGSSTVATLIGSINEFNRKFGARQSSSYLYDALDAYLGEGGERAYVAVVVGPAALAASLVIQNGGDDSLRVSANSVGEWGNDLNVELLAGPILQISDSSGILETSPVLADVAAAVDWARFSDYIVVVDLGAVIPPAPVAIADLDGGTSDAANIDDARWKAALDTFLIELGPGQVALPGQTSGVSHQNLLEHAHARNRIALLDAPDTSSRAVLAAATAALAGVEGVRTGAMFAPWIRIAGLISGISRTIPPSAIVAGLIARNDAVNSANVAAAGNNGQSSLAIDLTQPSFSEADRVELNKAGINLFRNFYGQIRLYGYRSLTSPVTDVDWVQLTAARIVMEIRSRADRIADRYVFAQLDGRGQTISAFGGELSGMLLGFWRDGALFGTTPREAFTVNVGGNVNTPESLRAGNLQAELGVRVSPFAELVRIAIVRSAITEEL